jgi:two-component system, OmpR family, response regulator
VITSPTPTAPPTVLVVEDDDDTRASLQELLEEHGYQVATARNGRDAETYLRHGPTPACVLLDLWMPVMDGWALAAEISAGHLPRVPFIVVTAAESYWGYPTPPNRVVRKPVNPRRILAMVDDAVRGNA